MNPVNNPDTNNNDKIFFGGKPFARKSSMISDSIGRNNSTTYGQSGGLNYANKLNRSRNQTNTALNGQ
jgi:hypothetical protein